MIGLVFGRDLAYMIRLFLYELFEMGKGHGPHTENHR
jgi:hypothetical protein